LLLADIGVAAILDVNVGHADRRQAFWESPPRVEADQFDLGF